MKPKGLGRGLDALLDAGESRDADRAALATLAVGQLQRGKYQPRTVINDAALQELADSIRKQGLMQPIVVRPLAGESGRYEIIAGERRWRAAQLAGLSEVPVVVRDVSDQAALAMALIENIQREDLNALEQAKGLERLSTEFGFTHQEIAEAVGRSRVAVTNLLRLLHLSGPVQQLLADGKLDMGHARALLALQGRLQEEAARRIAEKGLSVRETESWVQELLNPVAAAGAKPRPAADRDVKRLEEELSQRFGTTVEIRAGRRGSGKLVITYSDSLHLESLLSKIR